MFLRRLFNDLSSFISEPQAAASKAAQEAALNIKFYYDAANLSTMSEDFLKSFGPLGLKTYIHQSAGPSDVEISKDVKLLVLPIKKLKDNRIPAPFGVLANCFIAKDTIIAEYTGTLQSDHTASSKVALKDQSYVYHLKGLSIDAKCEGNLSRFINHSDNNNTYFYKYQNKVYVKALRDIQSGEQLLINYGTGYFAEHSSEKRIILSAYHSDKSEQELYNERLDHYKKLSELSDTDLEEKTLKESIKALFPEVDEKNILIPKNKYPNYPILTLNPLGEVTNTAELSLFHALCATCSASFGLQAIKNAIGTYQADVALQCDQGKNALLYLGENKNLADSQKAQILKLLIKSLDSFQPLYVSDKSDQTLYHYCLENKLHDCLKLLFKYNFNIENFDKRVESLFITGIKNNNFEGIQLLFNKIHHKDMAKCLQKLNLKDFNKLLNKISDSTKKMQMFALFSPYLKLETLNLTACDSSVRPRRKLRNSYSNHDFFNVDQLEVEPTPINKENNLSASPLLSEESAAEDKDDADNKMDVERNINPTTKVKSKNNKHISANKKAAVKDIFIEPATITDLDEENASIDSTHTSLSEESAAEGEGDSEENEINKNESKRKFLNYYKSVKKGQLSKFEIIRNYKANCTNDRIFYESQYYDWLRDKVEPNARVRSKHYGNDVKSAFIDYYKNEIIKFPKKKVSPILKDFNHDKNLNIPNNTANRWCLNAGIHQHKARNVKNLENKRRFQALSDASLDGNKQIDKFIKLYPAAHVPESTLRSWLTFFNHQKNKPSLPETERPLKRARMK